MKEKRHSILLHIAILLGLFLPDWNYSNAIQGIFPLILFIFLKLKGHFFFNKNSILVLIVFMFSFLVNVLYNNINIESFLRLLSFILLFGLFPFTKPIKISKVVLYLSLLFIFFSQIAYSFGIHSFINFFDNIYPYTGDKLIYQTDFLLKSANGFDSMINRRYGGLYHNPNQCVRYVSLIFIVFLIESKKSNNYLIKIPFIIIVYFSVLLSGSRTGLIVITFLILYDILIYGTHKVNFKKSFFFISFIIGLLIIYFYLSDFGFRIFDLAEGSATSLNAKFVLFNDFLKQLTSPVKFIFGHFSNENMESMYGMSMLDSEWGELFYRFGILGSIAIVLFYIKLWRTKDSNIRFFMVILLWGITSTILFSFKMSFLFMLMLSNYYSAYKINKNITI